MALLFNIEDLGSAVPAANSGPGMLGVGVTRQWSLRGFSQSVAVASPSFPPITPPMSPAISPAMSPASSPPSHSPFGAPRESSSIANQKCLSPSRMRISPPPVDIPMGVYSRGAQWAGTYYSRNPTALAAQVRHSFLGCSNSMPPCAAEVIIVPFGKLSASGAIAAKALRCITRSIDTIVVIGPKRKSINDPPICSVSGFKALETPIGTLSVDTTSCRILSDSNLFSVLPPAVELQEHCIEVLLPLLRAVAPKAVYIPILVSDDYPLSMSALSKEIANAIKPRKAVIIAAANFSRWGETHGFTGRDPRYGSDDAAVRATLGDIDLYLAEQLASCDPDALAQSPWRHSMSGLASIVLALSVARQAKRKLRAAISGHAVVRDDNSQAYQGFASMTFHAHK